MTRALGKLQGVKDVDANLDTQLVNVKTESGLTYDTVLATISKTGKTVNSGRTIV